MDYFNKKIILVTGACGTIGKGLISKLLDTGIEHVLAIDNNETELFFLRQFYAKNTKITTKYCDITDRSSISGLVKSANVVIHAAALKHVAICEDSPVAAIRNNVHGTQNIIDACIEHGIERMTFTSSDKAVNPTNVMGTTKLLGEKLVTAAAHFGSKTIFSSTRFGNVLGSNGSVIPIFQQQLENGQPITLTHEEMTRFVMTKAEACELVLKSVFEANSGETLVTKMKVMRIYDLAVAMHQIFHKTESLPEINIIGTKPGEKLYEELTTSEEIRRTLDDKKYLRIISPFEYQTENFRANFSKEYNSASEAVMSDSDITKYLLENRLI